jgi:hypothetical protein
VTEVRASRIASAAAVFLLHAGFLLALTAAMTRPTFILPARVLEVLLPPPREIVRSSAPALPLTAIRPEVPRTVAEPQIDIVPEAPSASALQGVGHALFGCDVDRLAKLTPEERAECLHFSYGKPKEPSLVLGPLDMSSPWAQAVAKRNARPVPITHACGYLEKPSPELFNLGMPCLDFTGDSLRDYLKPRQ